MWYVKSLQILSRKKCRTSIAVCLNILCLICINIHYPWNYAEFDNNAYFNELSLSTQWNNNDRLHTWLVQTKFNMGTLDPLAADRSLDFTCPGLAEPNSQLARVSAGQCEILWRYTICCNAHTLNNPQDLDLECLAAGFTVQWIRAMGAQVSDNVAWTVCRRFVLLKKEIIIR